MHPDLTGSVVVVTGASSGIGAATARLLHRAGAHPVLAARRKHRLTQLSRELGDVLAVPTEVTEPDDVSELVAASLQRHGRIDGLVNNAGVPCISRWTCWTSPSSPVCSHSTWSAWSR